MQNDDAASTGSPASESAPLRAMLARAYGRASAWLNTSSHRSVAQRVAGTAFLIRVASAILIYLSQIALARWMGRSEFGIYVYVWTWVLLIGDLVHLGLPLAAQRFIPEYTQQKAYDLLRGFVFGSRWLVFAIATAVAIVFAALITVCESWLNRYEILPLYLACLALPFYTFSHMLDGLARTYNWINVALVPPYFIRPLLLLAVMAGVYFAGWPVDSVTAMLAAVAASWLTAVLQLLILERRLAGAIPEGEKRSDLLSWFRTSLPIIMVWGFYTLLTYADILVLRQFRPPEEVALYHAASKTLALVAFVYFAVSAAVAHRFAEYQAAGDRERLLSFVADSIRWTFWPSLAAIGIVLAFGRPALWLFGPEFTAGYPLMFILAAGLLARAAVGPAERLLNMLGEQRACAWVYAVAFATNLLACFVLIPKLGPTGAALATATALVVESTLLFVVIKRRLGIHALVLGRRLPGDNPTHSSPATARLTAAGAE